MCLDCIYSKLNKINNMKQDPLYHKPQKQKIDCFHPDFDPFASWRDRWEKNEDQPKQEKKVEPVVKNVNNDPYYHAYQEDLRYNYNG